MKNVKNFENFINENFSDKKEIVTENGKIFYNKDKQRWEAIMSKPFKDTDGNETKYYFHVVTIEGKKYLSANKMEKYSTRGEHRFHDVMGGFQAPIDDYPDWVDREFGEEIKVLIEYSTQ